MDSQEYGVGANLGSLVALAGETTALAASGGLTADLTALHGRLAHPVDARVGPDALVARVNEDDLVVLVGRVLPSKT